MNENIVFLGRSEKQRQPSVEAYFASASEIFPNSDILKRIGELSLKDKDRIDYVLNCIGETISLFGEFEESSEKNAVAGIIRKIDALAHATEAKKSDLAWALVESIR